MLISLTTLLATLRSIFRSRAALELENLALRHQIGVLQRSARKRPKLTAGDRLLRVCLSRLWRDWRSALAIVKPETVVAWKDSPEPRPIQPPAMGPVVAVSQVGGLHLATNDAPRESPEPITAQRPRHPLKSATQLR